MYNYMKYNLAQDIIEIDTKNYRRSNDEQVLSRNNQNPDWLYFAEIIVWNKPYLILIVLIINCASTWSKGILLCSPEALEQSALQNI